MRNFAAFLTAAVVLVLACGPVASTRESVDKAQVDAWMEERIVKMRPQAERIRAALAQRDGPA